MGTSMISGLREEMRHGPKGTVAVRWNSVGERVVSG